VHRKPVQQPIEDCELLPSFDGSDHFLQEIVLPVGVPVLRGDRIYFEQNSKIDGCQITAVEVHYNLSGFTTGEIDVFQFYHIGAIQYTVIAFADYKNLLITLADKLNAQSIERMPAASFIALPNQPLAATGGAAPKMRKPIDLVISTNKSFIEFTNSFTPAVNTVVLISFYYQKK